MKRDLTRRDFIALAGCAAFLPWLPFKQTKDSRLAFVIDPDDSVANASSVRWALNELEQSLSKWNVKVERLPKVPSEQGCIVASGSQLKVTQAILRRTGVSVAKAPESLALVPTKENILLACGSDSRGLVYALLELCDRLNNAFAQTEVFGILSAISERPTNSIRSILRLFASEVEDKAWFNDREFWTQYLTMLATQRFNRFNLSLSLGYDFLRRVTDAYFLFPYPFLLSVPGYNVRVPQLPNTERDHNLEMLKFIGEQTVARGIDFQLGLWMHGYEWTDSPNANYTVEGLTRETHATYCRDALRLLLQSCPSISGVTIRTHGESGVEEGSYQFWQTIFEGVATCGRRVEIDLHPKGLDETMLRNAIATRQPITVSPKFWAEHLGLPYHQADIRQLEVPDPKKQTSRLMNLSEGSRSFMRYGYGDLLREDRTWKVIHRVWPGSQRLLLWGDPSSAAAYSKAFTFCGSNGAEIMEPLTFKGRRGSGHAGDRCAYADTSLRTRWDFQKYEYTYRVWGRLLYNPDSEPDVWQRVLRKQFGENTIDLETSLANASRILPLITTAHLPSAANNNYWPEMYMNQSLVDAAHPGSYSDTPAPKVFGNVSPLDPQLFYRINDYADDLLRGEENGKYSPLEVAQWLDDYVEAARQSLSQAVQRLRQQEPSPDFKRLTSDVLIQMGLGRFFAAKFRSAVLYRVFEKSGDRSALASSLDQYRKARDHWAEFSNGAKNVYVDDVTVGELPHLHGHWLDRLAAIERDIEAIDKSSESVKPAATSQTVAMIIQKVLGRIERSELSGQHIPVKQFSPGKPLEIEVTVVQPSTWAKLYYRHVNQAERFNVADMKSNGSVYRSTIPADYTKSNYPLQYYFEVRTTTGATLLYPGYSKGLMNQPYFTVRSLSL
ncbi:MAG: hypothetical protein C5B55_02635 [Blastocatellia bacterium]|nr:MAG: hypothetical protein C5B55_02635 [Blastocatellia bacterium]